MLLRRARRAFTLIEMLVVISVITIGLSLILPAFLKMTESNNYASAVNAVEATLRKAAGSGREGGVVFLYDIHTKRYKLRLVEWVTDDGLLFDPAAFQAGANDVALRAAVFRPVPGEPDVFLPAGMAVYGMSLVHDDYSRPPFPNGWPNAYPGVARWYEGEVVFETNPPANLPSRIVRNSWLFPRNDVQFFMENFNPNAVTTNHPTQRNESQPDQAPRENPWSFAQSFFIRFSAGGEMLGSSAPGPRDAYIEFDDLPHSADPSVLPSTIGYVSDRPRSFDPFRYEIDTTANPVRWVYNPEVRLRAVDLLAVVDLSRLSGETGVREPALVRARVSGSQAPPLPADKQQWEVLNPSDANSHLYKINRWIDDYAYVISFTRQTGEVVKR